MKRVWAEYWQVLLFVPVLAVSLSRYLRWCPPPADANLAEFGDDLFYYLQVAR